MIEEAAGVLVKRTDRGYGDEGADTHRAADLMPNVAAPEAAPAPS